MVIQVTIKRQRHLYWTPLDKCLPPSSSFTHKCPSFSSLCLNDLSVFPGRLFLLFVNLIETVSQQKAIQSKLDITSLKDWQETTLYRRFTIDFQLFVHKNDVKSRSINWKFCYWYIETRRNSSKIDWSLKIRICKKKSKVPVDLFE